MYLSYVSNPGGLPVRTLKRSKPSRRQRRDGRRCKKTLLLDQSLIDRARAALGARTETETVTQALEAVVRREDQIRGIEALARLTFDPGRID
jgi:hypothetical protein